MPQICLSNGLSDCPKSCCRTNDTCGLHCLPYLANGVGLGDMHRRGGAILGQRRGFRSFRPGIPRPAEALFLCLELPQR